MSQNLDIKINEDKEDILAVSLDGTLDTYTSNELEKLLDDQIQKNKIKFIFDCENLRFVSSSGMGCFINTLKKLKDKGGIQIYNITGKAEETLKVLGKYHKLFGIAQNYEEALQTLNTETLDLL